MIAPEKTADEPHTMFQALRPLVLASASPRRRDFLHQLGIDCRVLPPAGNAEPLPLPGETAKSFVARAAKAKADSVYTLLDAEIHGAEMPAILAADTVVFCEKRIYGKPANVEEAFFFLKELAGKDHTVLTACYLRLGASRGVSYAAAASVCMRLWPDDVLRAYADTGEGLDKAGAYAVQGTGGFLVERVRGSWSAVIGLPVTETVDVLMRHSIVGLN